ncbi:MAG TPA: hypothetical protein VM240_07535 [Verrucomicrobiae bacterium]|nr:hypothetical protein [Verrucomicrobiae bacterium]
MKKMSMPGAALLTLLLGGCGGGGGDASTPAGAVANEFCHTLPSGSAGCSGCLNVENPAHAFDGSFATVATIAPSGGGSFRGLSGDLQEGGTVAGVSFYLPSPAGISISMATLRGGTQQESAAPVSRQNGSDNCSGIAQICNFRDGQDSFVGFVTTLPFDGIQATISNTSTGEVLVQELCVD